jgi:glycosyltransferase involved in cell wall biosynthesis
METSSLRLMQGLVGRGHTLEVLSLHPVGALGDLLTTTGIPAAGLTYRGFAGWRSLPAMRAAIRQRRYDALIMTGHNLAAMLSLDRTHGRRRLLAMHYHHAGVKPDWQWRLIYAIALMKFNAISFPSDFARTEAVGIHRGVSRIASTIRNPVPLPRLPGSAARQTARQRLGLPAHARVIGNAGHLIARKRFDVFLEVSARVLGKRDDCWFLIAGDGELRRTLEQRAERLGIAGRVRWTGWLPDLSDFYCALDVLLFNSDWDAYPTTPLEAMSYAIPVVASSIRGGLSEAIRERDHGVLLARHDCDALAAAVLDALGPAAKRPGRLARARVAALCASELTVGKVESLLTDRT